MASFIDGPLKNVPPQPADEKIIRCNGKSKSDKEKNIAALSFTTSKLSKDSVYGTQELFRTSFTVAVEKGNIYFVTIPFPMTSCF